MKIGIDASRYSHESATGVEWYSKHIVEGLLKENKGKDEIILYSRVPLKLAGAKNRVISAKRFWTLWALSKEIKRDKPDVLFVPSHTLPLRLPKKSVIMIHDVAFKHLRKSYSFFQYHYLNWSTKYAVKHATTILVPSEATSKDLQKFYQCPLEKIVVIPHGFSKPEVSTKEIDTVFKKSEVFRYFGIHKGLDYLLFVGRLESKKNLERVVKAFSEFSETHRNFKLILAGKRGIGFERILKTINEIKIMDKMIMPGYITEEEKAALYKYSKAFVFPSLYEGFGLPILEAFYYEKPIITSHGSCITEVGGEAVCYVDPYDEKDLLKGMDKIINEPKYADQLVKMGQERLRLFSWEKSAKKTLEVLKN